MNTQKRRSWGKIRSCCMQRILCTTEAEPKNRKCAHINAEGFLFSCETSGVGSAHSSSFTVNIQDMIGTLGGLTLVGTRSRFQQVGKWTISAGSRLILCGVLIVITLVLVLPQVDLLDAAFHSDTAPVVVHHKTTAGLGVLGALLDRLNATVLVACERNETLTIETFLSSSKNLVSQLRC